MSISGTPSRIPLRFTTVNGFPGCWGVVIHDIPTNGIRFRSLRGCHISLPPFLRNKLAVFIPDNKRRGGSTAKTVREREPAHTSRRGISHPSKEHPFVAKSNHAALGLTAPILFPKNSCAPCRVKCDPTRRFPMDTPFDLIGGEI